MPYDPENGAVIYLLRLKNPALSGNLSTKTLHRLYFYDTKRLFYEPRFLDMCRKYAATAGIWEKEREKEDLTFENIQEKGWRPFDERGCIPDVQPQDP